MRNFTIVSSALALAFAAQMAQASGVTGGDLIISQVGDGSTTLSSAANATSIQEYTTSGTLVQGFNMPTSVSGPNRRLTMSGSATSEGSLNISADGNYATITGYDANVGTAAIASTTAAADNRVVGLLNLNTGLIDTSTAFNALFSANNIRSAYTTNGTDIWAVGAANGVVYSPLGATSGQSSISTTVANLRVVSSFGGDLYFSTGSGSVRGVWKLSGEPTSGTNVATSLFGSANASPYDFVVANSSTIYVADDTNTTGIQKWTFNGSAWSLAYQLDTDGARSLAFDASTSTIYAIDATGKLIKTTDTGSSFLTQTTVATPGANTIFRGVKFVPTQPVPEPASMAALGIGALGLIARRRRNK